MALWLIYAAAGATRLHRFPQCPNCGARGHRVVSKCVDCQHRGCREASGAGCWPTRQCPRCGSFNWRKVGYVRG